MWTGNDIVSLQVALHLLSEKEKRYLAQLVDTMVSYVITYKNVKSDPSSGSMKHEDALDSSMLSFEPPIGDFIKFKVCFGFSDK